MFYIKKIKNFLLVFSLTLVFAVSFSNPAKASSALSCSLTTAAGCAGTVVLRLSGSVNAHAELPGQTTANYASNVICCSGVAGLGTTCSGNYANIVKLSGVTNAHIEQNTQANYANNACLSVSAGTVTIAYQATDCTGYDTIIASMKSVTNSHVGGPAAYSEYKICGKVVVPPTLTSYTNTTDTTLNSANCATTGCGARIGGGAGFRQSITITGIDFGTDPGAANRSTGTHNIKIGTHQIASANVTAWSDTSITFLTDSAVTGDTDADWGTNFGGTNALTVTADGGTSVTGLNFYVLPQVTSITVPTAVSNAAREYNAADTDGIITLNGTRFGTAVTGGWVRILGCDSSTCSSPSGTAVTNSWSNTAITVQVPAVISDSVYTGSVVMQQGTGTSNKSHTYTASGFIILPRITSLSPMSGVVGAAVTVNGDHFCQSGTCPGAYDTNNKVTFTSASVATVFTSWSNTAIVTAVPTTAVDGVVSVTSNTYTSNNSAAFSVLSPVPNDPASPNQFINSTLTSALGVGSSASSTNLYLTMIMQSDISGGTLYPQIEYQPVGTAFTCTGTGTCASAVEGTGKAGPGPIDCSVAANGCSVTITPADGVYHWQARVRHLSGGTSYYSNWVSYGANSESATDFKTDKTGPVITFAGADTCASAATSVSTNGATISWTVNESATGQLEYSKSSTLSSSVNTAINSSAYSHSFTLNNLDSNTTYYFRAKSVDSMNNTTNRPSVSPYCSFTTGGVTQPAKTTKFYMGGVPGILSGGTATSSSFSVYVPENSVSVISAFVELTGISPSWGTNNISVAVNGKATSTYSIASGANSFKVLYPVSGSNLNFDPIANTLNISPSADLNISSAELVLTYSFAP